MELLLRNAGSSIVSSYRLWKKVLFDAFIGVVGVLGICLARGGLGRRSVELLSCKAATLAAVGMLRGAKLSGGKVRGCSCLLLCPDCLPSSLLRTGTCVLLRALGRRRTFVGSGCVGIEMLRVELL